MKWIVHRHLFSLALVGWVTVALSSGCDSDTSKTVKSLAIAPASLSLAAGTRGEVQATATFEDGSTQSVTAEATWTSSDAAVATVSSDASSPRKVDAKDRGQAQVRATYASLTAEAQVQVTDATLVSLALTPASPSLAVGLSEQLTATGTFTDGSTQGLDADVTWTSSDAAVATVSDAGLVRAVAPGHVTLKATRGTVEATTDVTVTPATVTAISVGPADAFMASGSTLPLLATATLSDGTSADVSTEAEWSSSDASILKVTGRNARGQAVGSARIAAAFRGVSGSTQVTVAEATALAVTPTTSQLTTGHKVQLKAEATLTGGHTQDVTGSATWASSNLDVAVISLDAATRGEATAVGAGSSTVTATFNGLSATAQVSAALMRVTATVPTFQPLEDGVLSFNARLTSTLPATMPLRWKLTLGRKGLPPAADEPFVGQAIQYFSGAAGEDPQRPETWSSFETDASGVGFIGPESGVPVGTTQLQSGAGQTTPLRLKFPYKGSYTLTLELYDLTDSGAPARIDEPTTLDLIVGSIRAPAASELLLYVASTNNDIDSEAVWPQAFSVYPDGTQLHQLTPVTAPVVLPRDTHSEVTRSPDRKTVAWVDGRDMSGGIFSQGLIYLADADGSNVRRLTQADASLCGEREVEFSPDGKWIAFVRSCSSDPAPGRSSTEFQFIIRTDGTDERRVFIPGHNDMPAPTPISSFGFGVFSRDSSTLYTVEFPAAGNRLWAWSLADGSSRLVVDFAIKGQEYASISKFPMVLPNGDLLYHYVNDEMSSDNWLERIKPDGTGREIVRPIGLSELDARYLQGRFALSPDGTRVAYAQWDDVATGYTITVSDLDGSNAVPMGNAPAYYVGRISWVK
ncbi:Ig-like domain-containing protein [Pyxidicoccus sp. MSG2]|uniref:Ig-like domain-containing protein n=1 Tax=Pyxidicoccus sp. MSG2 TaxID=2996790 RepID=UPI00226ECD7E|nr:Ig-like domain-containing protein [Pyxidicoccus sp. MSG2]MCY1022815.1 Ig-like domain-containing protein [Pyxidicoccus sp. MSG2]